MPHDVPGQPASDPTPLEAHLGDLDRVLSQARVVRLLLALQRRRESAEDRGFGVDR